jgi:lipopolysaccharide/colanic/teichoic acid biosynthesis glycosyltransferase
MPASSDQTAAAPRISAIYARRIYSRVLYLAAPAGVAAAITFVRTDNAADAVLMLAALVVTAAVLKIQQFPLHLVPLARVLANVLVPVAGVAVAWLAAMLGGGSPLSGQTAIAAAIGAVLIALLAMWLEDRFLLYRPIRIGVIGPAIFTQRLAAELAENGIHSYVVVGYLDEQEDRHAPVPWLGDLSGVRAAVQESGIDLLVVGPQERRLEVFEITAKACLDLPVRMIEATALYEDVLGHVPIGAINSAWFQFIMHPRFSPSSPLTKRLLDISVSGTLLLAASPLLILSAIAVKLDGGPVFYRQRRVGEEGRAFDMIKFRTLVPDADDQFAAGRSEEDLITRAGRILRKGHLNELPQLLQVLRGDISLVGPRPEPPDLVEDLSGVVPHYERRALVKPGLTGWAQVRCGYAGSHAGTAWKTCHDLYYIKHRSARFDLLICLQTLNALIERTQEEDLPAPDFILGEAGDLAHR